MRLDRWNKLNLDHRGSVYSLFDPGEETLQDIIVRDVVSDKSGEAVLPGLDIAPTTFNLVDLEDEHRGDPKPPCLCRLLRAARQVEDDYDYILFDNPPNLLRASQLGVFSANEMYIPANPDGLSLIGFTLLIEKLALFQKRSASFRQSGMGPAAVQRNHLSTQSSPTSTLRCKMRMPLRLNQFKTKKRMGPDAKIFDTQVRDARAVVRRAVTPSTHVQSRGKTR